MQVHEEVLRLLMAAVGQLSVAQLAGYLQTTLANSKRSRRLLAAPVVASSPDHCSVERIAVMSPSWSSVQGQCIISSEAAMQLGWALNGSCADGMWAWA